MIHINDIVQFNEKHNWCGCLGIVTEIENYRVIIGVPVPEKGTAYIFARPEELERIGVAVLVLEEN